MADFPDVPNVPGVPPLLRDPANLAGQAITLLSSDTVFGYGVGQSPGWGIYQNGAPVVIADTVVTLEYKQEWAIADYPVERGGFESYDKVDIPFDVRVRLAAGGSEANRQAMLDSVQAIAGNLQLYDVVTPETVYSSVNIQHQDYRRTARNGLGLIVIDVWLLEVRVTAGNSYGNAKQPSGATTVQDGSVQASQDAPPTSDSVQQFATVPSVPYPNIGQLPAPISPNASDLLPVQ